MRKQSKTAWSFAPSRFTVLIHFFAQGECVLEGEFLVKEAADLTYQKAVERRADERSDVYSVKAAKEAKR